MVLEIMPVLSVRSDLCQVKPHRSHVLKTVNISSFSLFAVIFVFFDDLQNG